MQRAVTALILPALLACSAALAQPVPPPAEPAIPLETETAAPAISEPSPAEKLVSALVMRDGEIELPGGKAKIKVAKGFAYLDPRDARTLLVDVYRNPPGVAEGNLGVIVPAGIDPLAAESWFAILTYEDDGHVSDEDASSINYDDLLKDMQTETDEESQSRVKEGFESLQLVGWAQKPTYDKADHKLYWAKNIKFGKTEGNTLNYAIRILGRTGVLQVNIVGDINQLKDLNPQVPGILKMLDFTKGQTYAEFNESTDQMAAYGLAGLIAGGVAAKAGLFKGLLLLLLASKKLLIGLVIGFGAAIWGGIKWFLGRGNSQS